MRSYLVTQIVLRHAAHMVACVGYMFLAMGVLAVCSLLLGGCGVALETAIQASGSIPAPTIQSPPICPPGSDGYACVRR